MLSAIDLYRMGRYCYERKFMVGAKFFEKVNYYLHNSYIPSSCKIGEGSYFAYNGISCVINTRAMLGKNCTIGQGVTIGTKKRSGMVPEIQDNVYLGAGSRILGGIIVGHDSIIGANAVVIQNVPPFSIVAGVPAKIIKKKKQRIQT